VKLKFPEDDLPAHLVRPHYSMVMKMHRHYNKMNTRQELAYIKYVAFFVIAFIGFAVMEGKGLVGNYLIAVACTGFGVIFAFVMSSRFISSEIDENRLNWEKIGKELEEKYSSIIGSSYFKMIHKLTAKQYLITIFSRITLFAFVGISTIYSAVMLSMRKNPNFAISVGVISSIALIAAMIFLARNIRACQKVKV